MALSQTVANAVAKKFGYATVGAATAFAGGLVAIASGTLKNTSNNSAFGTSLYFPNDLGSTQHPHYISFSFQEYQRRSIFDRIFLKDSGMVRLPPPNTMIDSSEMSFDTKGASLPIGAAIENALRGSKSVADIARSFNSGSILTGAAGVAGGALGGAAGGALGAAALVAGNNGAATNALDQALQIGGVAQNPFLTILFKSPTFKRHAFSWKFNPQNRNETEILRNIINKFKYHQHPDISNYTGGTLLSYPDIVLIGYYPDDSYLYKFKPCVIESFTVNYSPEGQASFFTSVDAPSAVEVRLNLLEIEYWIKPDILKAQGMNVGSANNYFNNDIYNVPANIANMPQSPTNSSPWGIAND